MMLQASPGMGASGETADPIPHNIQAEQGILGAILMDNRHYDRVSEIIEPWHFHEAIHADIYEAITKLIQSGRKADPVTLRTLFDGHPDITPGLSVPSYCVRMVAGLGSAYSAPDYARLVRDLAIRRELIAVGQGMAENARNAASDADPQDIAKEAETAIYGIVETKHQSRVSTFGTAAASVVDDWHKAYQGGPGYMSGFSSGLTDLDRIVGGFHRGNLIVLGGRPSMGKTALVMHVAWSVARSGTPVMVFSMEMSRDELAARQLAAVVGVSSFQFRRGEASEAAMKEAVLKANELRDTPLIIDETGGLTVAQLAVRARRAKRQHGIEIIVVDYLQLMAGSGASRGNRVADITEITTGLKALAKELDVPVIALSQLSRGVESRDNKRPMLSDLRESGSIEQDADVVMFVYREEYYLKRTPPPAQKIQEFAEWQAQLSQAAGVCEVIVAKNRHGGVGIAKTHFDEALTRFADLAGGR